LGQLGGWGELRATCAANAESFALWRPLSDPDFPWLGILIASPVIGIWYWCTDQYIIQRTLAAKSLKDARRGALFGGLLKVWPVMIFLVPGLIGWALHQKGLMVIPSRAEGGIDGDQVFATMVTNLLPEGMRGIVVAGLLSALMSSLASLFNSCATLFTVDIYEKLKPGKSQAHLVMVGRIATAIVVVLGIIWIPIMHNMAGGGLYRYLQSVQSYIAPPIAAVFLLGLFWRRSNSTGSFWGLIIGVSLGLGKLAVEAVVASNPIDNPLLLWIAQFNWLYYSGVLLGISILLVVFLSLMTEKMDESKMAGITYATLSAADKAEIRASWDKFDIFLTVLVLTLVLGMYLYFSFWLII
jgi:solute:Na+ symporter, SSS family